MDVARAAILLAVVAQVTSDSIMELINTQRVEKFLEQRRLNTSRMKSVEENTLTEDDDDEMFDEPGGKAVAPYPPLPSIKGQKLLKSTQEALLVTKKDYLRRDWCKTESLVQRIKEPGCTTRTMVNKFCYGQCNSFYIPKAAGRGKQQYFKSCPVCKPKKGMWVTISLSCPRLIPNYRIKKVYKIKQCRCMPESSSGD